ncbi:hypothetical protein ACN38_g8563 [Penicillium nordicum]|uniref:Uncharacterized protein n=1 Tax=Penicillium nordicum TaxID=229535 RepID=A0A0M8NWZ6_9EURO|nr:hypothetical protein ACN38_g8563 [Penicillium nordicum]
MRLKTHLLTPKLKPILITFFHAQRLTYASGIDWLPLFFFFFFLKKKNESHCEIFHKMNLLERHYDSVPKATEYTGK